MKRASNLAENERIVMAAIVKAAETGAVCPSNAVLAGLIGFTEDTAMRTLVRLERRGDIIVYRDKGARQVIIAGTLNATAPIPSAPIRDRKAEVSTLTAAQSSELLVEIEDYLRLTGSKPTNLCQHARVDTSLIARLRGGCRARPGGADQLRKCMAANPGGVLGLREDATERAPLTAVSVDFERDAKRGSQRLLVAILRYGARYNPQVIQKSPQLLALAAQYGVAA